MPDEILFPRTDDGAEPEPAPAAAADPQEPPKDQPEPSRRRFGVISMSSYRPNPQDVLRLLGLS